MRKKKDNSPKDFAANALHQIERYKEMRASELSENELMKNMSKGMSKKQKLS